jgi:hypothetical protein
VTPPRCRPRAASAERRRSNPPVEGPLDELLEKLVNEPLEELVDKSLKELSTNYSRNC